MGDIQKTIDNAMRKQRGQEARALAEDKKRIDKEAGIETEHNLKTGTVHTPGNFIKFRRVKVGK